MSCPEPLPPIALLTQPPLLPGRTALHCGMAIACSPLPGAVLIAARLLRAGNRRAAIQIALSGALVTFAGAVIGLLAPIGWAAALVTMLLLWLVAGVALALAERRLLAPARQPRDGRFLQHGLRWAIVISIAWFWVAMAWALVISEWGPELLLKPSAPRQMLLTALTWLFPLGLALGALRWSLGRPLRCAAPLAITAAGPLLLLACGTVVGLLVWVLDSLLLLPEVAVRPEYLQGGASMLFDTAVLLLPLILLAEFIASADGGRAFLARLGLASLTLAALFCNLMVLEGVLGVRWAERRALAAGARSSWAAQARLAEWSMRRAPLADVAPLSRERGAIAALRAGQPERARRLLASVVDDLAPVQALIELEPVAQRLLATRLDASGALAAAVRVIRPESYLASDQSAVLTAIFSARTEVSETRLKLELRSLSAAADGLKPPPVHSFAHVELWAAALGCVATAVPAAALDELLAAGTPVLFQDPRSGAWGLITWMAPDADALVWLDFSRYKAKPEQGLERRDIAQLVGSDEEATREPGKILAETSRLDATSLLRERLQLDGGWVVVIHRQADARLAADPASAALRALSQARTALDARGLERATMLASAAAAPAALREVGAIAELGLRARRLTLGETLPPPSPALSRLLDGSGIGALTPFAARELCESVDSNRELGCAARRALVERLAWLSPDSAKVQEELAHLRLNEDDMPGLAAATRSWARAARYEAGTVQQAIALAAPLAGRHPELRATIEELFRRLPPLITGADGEMRPQLRSRTVAGHAARAALSGDAAERVRSWREAVRLEPTRADFRLALAEALETSGQSAAAQLERGRGAALAGEIACEARIPVCR